MKWLDLDERVVAVMRVIALVVVLALLLTINGSVNPGVVVLLTAAIAFAVVGLYLRWRPR